MNLYCFLLSCLKGDYTCINSPLSKSVEYSVSSLFIEVKKYATNITLIVILCLNESVSRLIRLRYRNFIRDATKNLKINKKKKRA